MSIQVARPTLSVVVPMYNEEAVLPLLVERLRPALAGLGESYEVVAVDDGSTDATPYILRGLRRSWPQLRTVRLHRNGGHQAALTAGLHRAFGQYVVSIDADLQDPPESIPQMLELARQHHLDIVYGVRTDHGTDGRLTRVTARVHHRVLRRLVGKPVPDQAGDFRLLSRAAVDALRALPESRPAYRLLVPWIGFPSGEVYYVRAERAAGRTRYPLARGLRVRFDTVVSFSSAPLRVATWLGLGSFAFCVVVTLSAVVAWGTGTSVPGSAWTTVAVLFIGALQLLCLGLLGEYVARIYTAAQGRPSYFVAYDSASGPAPRPDGSHTGHAVARR